MQRRRVLLPLPDGPTRASNWPGGHAISASSDMGADWRARKRRPGSATAHSHAAGEQVHEPDGDEGKEQEQGGHGRRGTIVESLRAVVNRDGDRSRLARDVAAHHEYHAE